MKEFLNFYDVPVVLFSLLNSKDIHHIADNVTTV